MLSGGIMPKLLTGGGGVAAIIVQKGGQQELHVAVDITHDPWKILAKNILGFVADQLDEMGDCGDSFKQLQTTIAADESSLQ
jgi:hypothetical protein